MNHGLCSVDNPRTSTFARIAELYPEPPSKYVELPFPKICLDVMPENPVGYVLGCIEKYVLPHLDGWIGREEAFGDQSKLGCSTTTLLENVRCPIYSFPFLLTKLAQRKVKID